MTSQELLAILPLLILSAGIVWLLLQVSFWRNHRGALIATLAILALAIWSCFIVAGRLPDRAGIEVTDLFLMDYGALFFQVLMLLAAIPVAFLGYHYLKARQCDAVPGSLPEEFYILLLLVILGSCCLASASHFASLFLSLELMGLALYPLLGFSVIGERSSEREQLLSLESSTKYLILSALSSALLLFGIAMVYAGSGGLEFSAAAAALRSSQTPDLLMPAGFTLLLVAAACKLSLVPFHIWTPDVYQGAPTPVTALIATIGKGAVIAVVLRLFSELELLSAPALNTMLVVMAVSSMLVGNLLALLQQDVKRLLAYSSIAHIGYLFVAFMLSGSTFGVEAVIYYLVAYVITTLGAFAVVSLIADAAAPNLPGGDTPPSNQRENPFHLEHYRGLLWRQPLLASCFGAILLSLAGIPLTIGFIGKFYIFAAGVQGQLWVLLGAVVVGSALGLYYYLRLLLIMVQREETPEPSLSATEAVAVPGQLLVSILTVALLVFGIFPQLLINWINAL